MLRCRNDVGQCDFILLDSDLIMLFLADCLYGLINTIFKRELAISVYYKPIYCVGFQ